MKRIWATTIIVVLMVAGIFPGNAFFGNSDGQSTTAQASEKQQYTCAMHPEIISDKPGNCPVCKMKLIPISKESQAPTGKSAATDSSKATAIKAASGVYTCPMDSHADIVQLGPGKCPECGMKLVAVEETKGRIFYECPMPQDSVVMSKPGKCPKCGMELIKKTIAPHDQSPADHPEAAMKQMKMDGTKAAAMQTTSGVYTCPMDSHSHVVRMAPGKCPECGMKLIPVEESSGRSFYICPMTEDSIVTVEAGRCPKCGMNLAEKTVKGK